MIALGGGLSQAPEVFDGLEAAVDAKTLPATRGKVRVLPAMLSVDAGAIGAALVGRFDRCKQSEAGLSSSSSTSSLPPPPQGWGVEARIIEMKILML